jgi:hypothetical protein
VINVFISADDGAIFIGMNRRERMGRIKQINWLAESGSSRCR